MVPLPTTRPLPQRATPPTAPACPPATLPGRRVLPSRGAVRSHTPPDAPLRSPQTRKSRFHPRRLSGPCGLLRAVVKRWDEGDALRHARSLQDSRGLRDSLIPPTARHFAPALVPPQQTRDASSSPSPQPRRRLARDLGPPLDPGRGIKRATPGPVSPRANIDARGGGRL